MSSDSGGVYILRDHDEGEWVAPEPASTVLLEELLAATDLQREDIEPLTDHVDFEALGAVLAGDAEETITFSVEGHEVTVGEDGSVDVAPA